MLVKQLSESPMHTLETNVSNKYRAHYVTDCRLRSNPDIKLHIDQASNNDKLQYRVVRNRSRVMLCIVFFTK